MMPKTVALCGGAYYIRWNDGLQEWNNIPYRLETLLKGRAGARAPGVELLALGPNGAWFVKFEDQKCKWSNLPQDLEDELLRPRRSIITCLALGPNESWVVCYNNKYVQYNNIHPSLENLLQDDNEPIENISLGTDGHWTVVFADESVNTGGMPDHVYKFYDAVSSFSFVVLDSEIHDFFCLIGDGNKCFASGYQDFMDTLFTSDRYSYRLLSDDIMFLQDSINFLFKDGSSIYDLAKQLAFNQTSIEDIPKIRVVQDDNIYWSLDNRRLWAFKAAGFKSIPVVIIDPNSHYDRLRQQGKGGKTVKVRSLVS